MLTDKLNGKLEEAKGLTRKLDRSLALLCLWPEVFNNGAAHASWHGVAPRRTRLTEHVPEHTCHEFRVTSGEGEKRAFTYEEVPEILGGGLKIEEYIKIEGKYVKVTDVTIS